MRFHTYILKSERSGMLYIGQTSDVEKRLARHNAGGSRFTKGKGPWVLLYFISFETKTEAILMEKKLKAFKNTGRIREWIKRPYLSIDMYTTSEAHRKKDKLSKRWKSNYKKEVNLIY